MRRCRVCPVQSFVHCPHCFPTCVSREQSYLEPSCCTEILFPPPFSEWESVLKNASADSPEVPWVCTFGAQQGFRRAQFPFDNEGCRFRERHPPTHLVFDKHLAHSLEYFATAGSLAFGHSSEIPVHSQAEPMLFGAHREPVPLPCPNPVLVHPWPEARYP